MKWCGLRCCCLGSLASLVVLIAAGFWAIHSGLPESLLFQPSPLTASTPPGAKDVRIPTADGLTLYGWFFPGRGKAAPAVLFVHGNGGSIGDYAGDLKFLHEAGYALLVFDYRSYGKSDKSPRLLNRGDAEADTLAALDWLSSRKSVDRKRVAVYGFSLGGVLGLAAAAQRPQVSAVISASAFSSWQQIAKERAGKFGRELLPAGLDAVDSVRSLGHRPLLLLHGDDDLIVQPSHAKSLEHAAQAAGVRVKLVTVSGAGHNDVLSTPESREAVLTFLSRTIGIR